MAAKLLCCIVVAFLLVATFGLATSFAELTDELMHPRAERDQRSGNSQQSAQNGVESTAEHWLSLSKKLILEKAYSVPNTRIAKNIILFLGDGMGLATLAAARNIMGGEAEQLAFEKFPYTGLSKTYCVDKIVADSASTATAYLCGVKGNYGTIGVSAQVNRGNCAAMANKTNHVHSLAKWALDQGLSAGLVTNTRVTHASPAGVYAHTADRNWEYDDELNASCDITYGLQDIALQLIHGEVGSKLKVMLGGGKSYFYEQRTDGRNLIDEFQKLNAGNVFVETQKALLDVNVTAVERLLGLFASSHMSYHLETLAQTMDTNNEPTLEQMTKKAIEVMQTDTNGYFLFIEGGKIDMAHHETYARIALDETIELSKAVARARQMTSEEDTLIVVTADHSHTFSMAGYQPRGSNIFATAKRNGNDNVPYLALSYANGKSFNAYYNGATNKRVQPETVLQNHVDDLFPATVPLGTETHGGEDVAVFASGPWAHLFTGVYEQNAIPHMLAYAACIGEGLKACD